MVGFLDEQPARRCSSTFVVVCLRFVTSAVPSAVAAVEAVTEFTTTKPTRRRRRGRAAHPDVDVVARGVELGVERVWGAAERGVVCGELAHADVAHEDVAE